MFRKYKDIETTVIKEEDYLKTGIKAFDKKCLGFGKGQLVIITGTRGSGKTSILGQIKLNFINNGYRGIEYNLEMKNDRAKQWVMLQASGKDNLTPRKTSTGGVIYEPKNDYVREKICEWLDDKLLVYDNKTFNAKKIFEELKEYLDKYRVDFCIVDNLFRMDIGEYGNEKYLAQTKLIKDLQVLCQQRNVCLVLVCHPTKVKTCPRIEDVSGSGDLVNACDTCLIVHRITNDFKRRAEDTFGWDENHAIYYDGLQKDEGNKFATFVEIAKDREFGNEGAFIGMHFENESKRFLNDKKEYIHYGWEEKNEQSKIKEIDDIGEIF